MKRFKYLTLVLIVLLVFSSCNYEDANKRKEYFQKYSKRQNEKLKEDASFLGHKHAMDASRVESLLLDYLKEYDNFSYQMITNGAIDKKTVSGIIDRQGKQLHLFVTDYSKKNAVLTKMQITNIVYDYKQMLYNKEIESLRETVEDLEYRLENVTE